MRIFRRGDEQDTSNNHRSANVYRDRHVRENGIFHCTTTGIRLVEDPIRVSGIPTSRRPKSMGSSSVAFHFTDYLTDPEAIIKTYMKVDQLTLESINEILKAANLCGFAMRDKVMATMN